VDDLPLIDDLRELFLDDRPLLDVRAPGEFADGAFPSAENHPLIDDTERHEIGLVYAERGQDEAIALGTRLVSGKRNADRIDAWRRFVERHPDAVLYCFRGGMRSQISQRWLFEETGLRCPRVRGGYKRMRRFLIDELETNGPRCRPVVIGGRTGVGKTRLLQRCRPHVDLERLAHHRGSAFGHHPQPQPAQVDFENALSVELMRRVADANRPFVVEDESRNIGSRHIPPVFFERLQEAPLVLLDVTLDERIETTLQEYVHDALHNFSVAVGHERAFEAWADYLRRSLSRIRKRLGGDRYRLINDDLDAALTAHREHGETEGHRAWIERLLVDYYDGMYEYQLAPKQSRIVFHGDRDAVLDYLSHEQGIETDRDDPRS
jgi:tRNA 2-selenouridine synthase